MRFAVFVFLLALSLLIPFLIWGDQLEALFGDEAALQAYGRWAWLAGIVLLVLDLFLPIPGTAVMTALGYVYGTLAGGTLAAVGSVLSGMLAYGLCRSLGRNVALKLVGEKSLAEGEHLFEASGGWIVAGSRWLPLLPEVVACVAGAVKMPLQRFVPALACGSVPLGFAFAALGSAGNEYPAVAFGASIALPPLLWLLVGRRLARHRRDRRRQ